MLAPLAPHFASELWSGFCSVPRLTSEKNIDKQEIQWDKDVLQQKWPEVDMEYELDLTVYVSREIMILSVNPANFIQFEQSYKNNVYRKRG